MFTYMLLILLIQFLFNLWMILKLSFGIINNAIYVTVLIFIITVYSTSLTYKIDMRFLNHVHFRWYFKNIPFSKNRISGLFNYILYNLKNMPYLLFARKVLKILSNLKIFLIYVTHSYKFNLFKPFYFEAMH